MPAMPSFLKNLPELQMDESKKKILIIYGSAFLAILLVYFFFFLKPSMGKLFDLMPRVRERRIEIKTVRRDLAHEDLLKKRLEALEQKMGRYEKKLSREKEIPMLLENLSKLAKNSRVKILSITPIEKKLKAPAEAAIEDSVYQEVPIAINAQSGYHELGTFINRLENSERYMQVSDIKIKSGKANPKRHDIEFIVYVYTFEK